MINAVILNLGISVAVFVLLILISKQPADKGRGRTDFTFTIPLAPWSQALAIFLNLSLLARILHSAWLELIVWLCLGMYVDLLPNTNTIDYINQQKISSKSGNYSRHRPGHWLGCNSSIEKWQILEVFLYVLRQLIWYLFYILNFEECCFYNGTTFINPDLDVCFIFQNSYFCEWIFYCILFSSHSLHVWKNIFTIKKT